MRRVADYLMQPPRLGWIELILLAGYVVLHYWR